MIDFLLGWLVIIMPTLFALGIEVIDERVRKNRSWRIGVIVFGISLSALTWSQQTRSLRAAASDRETAIKETSKRIAEDTSRNVTEALKSQYQESFNVLSQKVADLQAKVKTEELQKQVRSLQADLNANTKALGPGPKAELTFTFAPFPNLPQSMTPVKDVNLPINADGSVHIDFNIVNLTDVDAVDVEVNVNICDGCKYAKDPEGLSKLPGLKET